jgi:subtilisin family serine protease
VIKGLTARGAVIVASAGNGSDANPRHRSMSTHIVNMPIRLGPRYPAAFPETISVGAVDSKGVATTYSDFPAMYPKHNGIATLGGDLPTPIPPLPDPDVVTKASVNDPVRGLYSADTFPVLSAEDMQRDPPNPPIANTNGWAYWSGTSFATPIISAVAARVLESIKASGEKVASSQLSARVQWAITSPDGQQEMLTGSAALPTNSAFGANVGVLKAKQVSVPVAPEVPGAGPEPVAVS